MAQASTIPSSALRHPVRKLQLEVLRDGSGPANAVASGDVLTVGTARDNDVVLSDPKVSRYHLRVRALGADIIATDLGSTNGTCIGPVTLADASVRLEPGTLVGLGDSTVRVGDGGFAMRELHEATSLRGIVGTSAAMRELMARVRKVAPSSAPLLILGESGTGKELVAQALHEESPRHAGPFVTVDGAALTESLFASELFGHERGAFTGAHQQHIGAFERADGGTLFLDEVGELSEPMQSMLLGAIERGRFRRVGGTRDIAVDVRLVSATHQNLRAHVNSNRFRLDLYYRLAVVVLEVPPLRERPEAVEPLTLHFLHQLDSSPSVASLLCSPEQLRALERHAWPGNVRELRNVVMRAMATGEQPVLEGSVATHSTVGGGQELWSRPYKEARRTLLDQFELGYLQRLLERNDGSLRKSAREAGIDRSYLIQMLRKHGLKQ
jgi:DNA-binding NtrC family response regulator